MQFRVKRQVKFGRFNEDLKCLLSKAERELNQQLENLVSNELKRIKLPARQDSEAMFRVSSSSKRTLNQYIATHKLLTEEGLST